LGAILEQRGRVITFASRSLKKSERNYSAIEKECLAIIFTLKTFRHYLLGRSFTILSDHAPLQWLAAQKMDGRLARWALSLQEYYYIYITLLHYITDSFTKWLEALPMKDQTATTVARKLTAVFCRFGIPETTLCYQNVMWKPKYSRRIEEIRRSNREIFEKSSEWRKLTEKMEEYKAARKEAINSNDSSNLANSNDNQAAASPANRNILPEQQAEQASSTNAENNTIMSYIPTLFTGLILCIIDHLITNLF
ncbi:Retrovirus-related Pol polyprotein from transposon, partial [Trichinella murrelli]